LIKNNLRIGILGSTGSIGCNTLEVIKNLRNNGYNIEIKFLTTNSKVDLLFAQAEEFNPEYTYIYEKEKIKRFKELCRNNDKQIIEAYSELIELIGSGDYDILINSLVGISGLLPTIEALKSGKTVALANKETMVVAGELINSLSKKFNARLIPIDSEHSAILQCLQGERKSSVRKIILTASGGPFKNKTTEELKKATKDEALNHPNWKMGKKITIDSASLMNKGLEVIEARWLFDFTPDMIEVLIHPQSIIHSMIEFVDGSIKAQLGMPDMKIPIQYALTYPERFESDFPKINFSEYKQLTFEEPDFEKFECLKLAYQCLEQEGTYSIVLNASNEIAVNLFLQDRIKFLDIPIIIKKQLEKHNSINNFELEDIIEIDELTRLDVLHEFSM
jgi:1-deoxy-D-xylulose-5-phosphate reductoisomerase